MIYVLERGHRDSVCTGPEKPSCKTPFKDKNESKVLSFKCEEKTNVRQSTLQIIKF